jgi:hypothetical protein
MRGRRKKTCDHNPLVGYYAFEVILLMAKILLTSAKESGMSSSNKRKVELG